MGNVPEPLTYLGAEAFARSWADAWNSHDPSRIAAHYREDVEYHSPFVARLTGGGALYGRTAVEDYVAAALARYPELHFGPEITVATGARSIALVYRSVEDLLAVETLVLDDAGLVARADCHYRCTAPAEPTVAPSSSGS
jgi:nuclear transport factor 2 (NTF2) superfamily protein